MTLHYMTISSLSASQGHVDGYVLMKWSIRTKDASRYAYSDNNHTRLFTMSIYLQPTGTYDPKTSKATVLEVWNSSDSPSC
jgi:hypothetical protein